MNWTATRDAIGSAGETVDLITSLLYLTIFIAVIVFVWRLIKRAFGYDSFLDMLAESGSGPLARRRRVEKRHLQIRGPHYVSARDRLTPKPVRVITERTPKDPTGGVRK